jgi:competence protein ComEA
VRRLMGVVVVLGMIGLWNWMGARSLRPVADGFDPEHAVDLVDSQLVNAPPVTATAQRHATQSPALQRSSSLAGSSFRANPLTFLSTAPAESLDLLPGVGPVIAGRIIDARRARGSFASWDDVLAVRGVGPATITRWRALAGK